MAQETTQAETTRGPLARVTTWMENLSEEAYAYLLLTPAFTILTVVAFWPLLETFRSSLYGNNIGRDSLGEFVGVQNYVKVLTANDPFLARPLIDPGAPLFRQALIVTVLFTVISVFFETLIGYGQAQIMAKEYRGRRWVRVAIILPWAIPIVVQGMIFFLFFSPSVGFVTEPLIRAGVFGPNPLSDSQDAFIIVTVADIWKTSAFMALLILAGMQSIDDSLYEVARVAGASVWQRFRYITLPLLLPVLLVAMLFRTIQAMRVYGVIEATGAGCTTVPSLSCLVVETLFGITSAPASAAAVAFLTAVIIGVLIAVYLAAVNKAGGSPY